MIVAAAGDRAVLIVVLPLVRREIPAVIRPLFDPPTVVAVVVLAHKGF